MSIVLPVGYRIATYGDLRGPKKERSCYHINYYNLLSKELGAPEWADDKVYLIPTEDKYVKIVLQDLPAGYRLATLADYKKERPSTYLYYDQYDTSDAWDKGCTRNVWSDILVYAVPIITPNLMKCHRLLPPEHVLRLCDFVYRDSEFKWEPVIGLLGRTVSFATQHHHSLASCHVSDWPKATSEKQQPKEEVVAEETTLSLLKELCIKIFG